MCRAMCYVTLAVLYLLMWAAFIYLLATSPKNGVYIVNINTCSWPVVQAYEKT